MNCLKIRIVAIFLQLAMIPVISEPDYSLVGFAEGVTGGTGGRTVQTQSASQFKSYCESSERLIIEVTGRIDNTSTKIKSNKTIIGQGTSGEIKGSTLSIGDGSNIIIRNMIIHHAPKGKDVISISGGNNIWIDHCDIYSSIGDLNGDGRIDTVGDISGGDVDWYDGLIDMTESSKNITISWNIIHDSFKSMLVGKSDSDDSDRRITFHHNYFHDLWERVPSYRGGTGHVYNNYFKDIIQSAVNSRRKAKLLVEGNVFENVGNGGMDPKTDFERGPIGAYYSGTIGYWDVKDNVFVNCKGSQPTASTCSFTPPYSYSRTLQPSDEIKETVLSYAGVGKLDAVDVSPQKKRPSFVRAPDAGNAVQAMYTCRGKKIPGKEMNNRHASGIIIIQDHSGVRVFLRAIR